MTAGHDLARGVGVTAGALAAMVAGGCGLLLGRADAAGALLGGGLSLANFGGLLWAAGRAAGAGTPSRLLWIGGSGARLLAVGMVAAWAVAHGWVGLVGFALSLVVVPAGVIVAGLRSARA